MKMFKGSNSIAMGWIVLILGTILTIILKDVTAFAVAVPTSGGLVANKTYQARKGHEQL